MGYSIRSGKWRYTVWFEKKSGKLYWCDREGIADTESRQAILRPTLANPGEQESHVSR